MDADVDDNADVDDLMLMLMLMMMGCCFNVSQMVGVAPRIICKSLQGIVFAAGLH